MEIKHQIDGSKGAFFVEENGNRLAEMTYTLSGTSHIVIEHTGVSSTLKGQGVGKLLVRAGVDYARKNGLKILPLCRFAKAEFDKTPEFADVRLQ
jgi:predicted GNAT family acetyltransferase